MGIYNIQGGQVVIPDITGKALFFGWSKAPGINNYAMACLVVSQVTAGPQCIEKKCFELHMLLFLDSTKHWDKLVSPKIFSLIIILAGSGDAQHTLFIMTYGDNHLPVNG